jgi:hypothetical protein
MSFREMAFNMDKKEPRIGLLKTQFQKQVRNVKVVGRIQQASAPPAPLLVRGRSAITGGYEFTFAPVGGSNVAGYKVYKSLANNVVTAEETAFVPQPPLGQGRTITHQHITSGSFFFWLASVNHAGRVGTKVPMAGAAEPVPTSTSAITGGNTSAGSGFGSGGGAAGKQLLRRALAE